MTRHFTIAANQGAIGGGEVMLLALAEAARALGREVTVVAPAQPAEVVDEAKRRGFHTVAIHGDSTADYLRGLRTWDRKHRQGLLWCNGLRPAFATSGRPQRIVELHQIPTGKLAALAAIATRGAMKVLVPSHTMAKAVPGTEVLWNWSDPVTVSRPKPNRPFNVGFLGRLSSDKGLVVLCEAISLLAQRNPGKYQLVIAGESRFVSDEDAQLVNNAIAALGKNAVQRGWISRDDFFSSIDLAVFPSVWAEPFGLVVTEAMSAKVPFVVSDAGALPEVAGDGYISPAGDAEALAAVIEQAAAAPSRYLDQGYQRWQEHFSPEAGQQRLGKILDEVDPQPVQVALAHDYFTQRGGAERVALALAETFPDAEMTTALANPGTTFPEVSALKLNTSWLDRLPIFRKDFRLGLPLYPLAFSSTTAGKNADVVIASTTAFAHGVKTSAKKVVYCHSPGRFLYLVDDYLGKPWWKSPTGWALMAMRPGLIAWDKKAAASADRYLCNSTIVKDRIKDVYGIDATVVHPPYAIDPAGSQEPLELPSQEFYLVVSRLMPYKNVDVVIETFRGLPDKHLLIVGKGPLRDKLRANLPSNVTMAEGISDAQLRWAYGHATAVIAPSHEDFGLTPVEGFAFGTPTIALRAGGYLDTVVEGVSGVFFEEVTPAAIAQAITELADHPLAKDGVVAYAQKFSPEAFSQTLRRIVDEVTA